MTDRLAMTEGMAPSAPNSDNVTDNVAGTAASELTAPDRPQREGRGPRADRQDRGDRGDRGGRQRGPRPDRNDGNDRGDRNRGPRDARFGDSDLRDGGGRRIDLSPPKFNVDELFAVAGPPLWQAVHAATVVEVTEAAIIVELKPEGHPALKAMIKSNEWPDAAVGAAAQVRLLDPAKANQPMPMASLRQAQDLQRLADLAVLQTQDRPIVQGTIVHEVRGGYAVAVQATDEIGDGALRAFLPFSQATMNRFGPGRGEKMLDLSDTFAVTEIDVQRMNIVVSRKAIMNALRDHDMQQKLAALTEGAIVKGTIRSIVAYGAFLDVDGVDALLHRDDVAHDFRGRIDAHLKTGDVLNVKVLSVKENKLKVGLKQTKGDPWAEVRAAFASGTVVKGTIVSLADFGAFVRLPLPSNPQESVEGLIHVSEISYSKIRHPSTKFSIGQEVDVKVLGLDAEHRRISLSTRVLERNPFEAVAEKFPAGTVIRAKIKTLAEFGAFLELADGVDGLIHISELSWTEAPNHPSEVVNIGQEVEAVVMGVDVAKQRVSCSMKRTQQNPFDAWEQKYQPGTRLQMKVIKAEDKGCFLEVEAGLSCFCSWRDLVDVNGQAVERAQDAVKLNQMIDVQVRSFERRFKKVSVSMRAIVESDTKAAYDEYKQREQAGPLNSMADALRKRETKS